MLGCIIKSIYSNRLWWYFTRQKNTIWENICGTCSNLFQASNEQVQVFAWIFRNILIFSSASKWYFLWTIVQKIMRKSIEDILKKYTWQCCWWPLLGWFVRTTKWLQIHTACVIHVRDDLRFPPSGWIRATSHDLGPQKGSWGREIPLYHVGEIFWFGEIL